MRKSGFLIPPLGALLLLGAVCGEDPMVPAGAPPTACFTVEPLAGDSATPFRFDASCSRDDEDAAAELRFDWDWDGDGRTDLSQQGLAPAWRTLAAGERLVILTVTDSDGLADSDSLDLTVTLANTPPNACFSVDPASGTTSMPFAFDAACTVDVETPADSLRFDWDWDGDGLVDHSALGDPAALHRFDAAGEHAVVLTVTDGQGASAADTASVSVSAATPPPGAFVALPPGAFVMGSLDDAPDANGFEYPRHEVTLTRGFRIQTTEVTNAQYMEMMEWAVMRGHASYHGTSSLRDALDGSTVELLDMDSVYCEIDYDGLHLTSPEPNHPVRELTWYGAAAYCDWLSLREGLPRAYDHSDWSCGGGDPYSAWGYRLPTEAEWEYACRASTDTSYCSGMVTHPGCSPLDPALGTVGWYCGNASGQLRDVASLAPNAWGLHDMHGNLAEWCGDWFDADTYENSPPTDPLGAPAGIRRIRRGGTFSDSARHLRSATRRSTQPNDSNGFDGFRPVRQE